MPSVPCEVCGYPCCPMADGDKFEYQHKIYDLKVCYRCDQSLGVAAYEMAAMKQQAEADGYELVDQLTKGDEIYYISAATYGISMRGPFVVVDPENRIIAVQGDGRGYSYLKEGIILRRK